MSDFESLDQWLGTATFSEATEMQKRTLTDVLQTRAQAAGRAPLNRTEIAAAFSLTHAVTVRADGPAAGRTAGGLAGRPGTRPSRGSAGGRRREDEGVRWSKTSWRPHAF